MKKFTLAILLAISLIAHAQEQIDESTSTTDQVVIPAETPRFPSFISQHQAEVLALAQQIAEKDGQREPKLLQGLLMQESSAGGNPRYMNSPDGNYGVAQIRVSAARHVLREFPELIDEFQVNAQNKRELIKKLINDDAFNISVASKYLLILQKAGYSTMKQLALAYNQGAGGAKRFNADTFPYVKSVLKQIRMLQ